MWEVKSIRRWRLNVQENVAKNWIAECFNKVLGKKRKSINNILWDIERVHWKLNET